MTTNFKISIIIPVKNRLDVLKETLQALKLQTLTHEHFEVILVDDGSTEDLAGMLPGLELDYTLHTYRQSHRGPAAARNLGASKASGEVLLFLDSDMIATQELLEQHLASHKNPHRLVVGPRSCYPNQASDNHLDQYDYRSDGTDLRFDRQPFTYQEAFTCNLSIQKEDWLQLNGFDERFPTASFEDIEFAYRAEKESLSICFDPKALAYHNHSPSLKERCERAISYSRTVPLFYSLHPEIRGEIAHLKDKEPIVWNHDSPKMIIRKLMRILFTWSPILWSMEWVFNHMFEKNNNDGVASFLYWKIIGSYLLIGLREGIRLYGWN